MQYVLLQAVSLPLLLSPVAYYLGRKSGPNAATWFTFGVLLYCTTIMIAPVFSGTYEEHYPWTKMFGEFGFLLDGLASPFAIIIYVLSTVLAIYSKPYMVAKITEQFEEKLHHQKQLIGDGQSTAIIESSALKGYLNNQIGIYFALYLVFAMGMLGTVLATNLIEFYVFFEVMLIPGFFLIAFYGYGARRRIALMFFFWTHVGAVVLLLGLIAMGLSVGSFDMADIIESSIPADLLPIIAVAIIIGLIVKLAIVPVHIWLPYAHAEAPTPISALLSPAMIGIGGYALMRLLMVLMPNTYQDTSLWLCIGTVITMRSEGGTAVTNDAGMPLL